MFSHCLKVAWFSIFLFFKFYLFSLILTNRIILSVMNCYWVCLHLQTYCTVRVSVVGPSVNVRLALTVTGCSRTHSAVTLGDWSDPLDPDVETQTIYKQLLQGRDKLRSVAETAWVLFTYWTLEGSVVTQEGMHCLTAAAADDDADASWHGTQMLNCQPVRKKQLLANGEWSYDWCLWLML